MTDKQLKMQEAIMIAIHWDLEKSRKKENMKWALTSSWFTMLEKDLIFVKWWYNWEDYDDDEIEHISYLSYPLTDDNWNMVMDENWKIKSVDEEIIWLPPTLSRVLTAINKQRRNYYYHPKWYIYVEQDLDEYTNSKFGIISTAMELCEWRLLNEDWSDATLFDQSEATQDIIYNLLIS